ARRSRGRARSSRPERQVEPEPGRVQQALDVLDEGSVVGEGRAGGVEEQLARAALEERRRLVVERGGGDPLFAAGAGQPGGAQRLRDRAVDEAAGGQVGERAGGRERGALQGDRTGR